MLTSTWPLELFRPITMRFCRIRYSSSRPSSLAITPVTSWSGAHCTLVGLPGMDLSACSVQSVSDDMALVRRAQYDVVVGGRTNERSWVGRRALPRTRLARFFCFPRDVLFDQSRRFRHSRVAVFGASGGAAAAAVPVCVQHETNANRRRVARTRTRNASAV